MSIRFACHQCQARIRVPDGSAGRKVKCPKCGTSQRVPAESQADRVEAAAEPMAVAGEEGEMSTAEADNPLADLAAAAGPDTPHAVVAEASAPPALPSAPPRPRPASSATQVSAPAVAAPMPAIPRPQPQPTPGVGPFVAGAAPVAKPRPMPQPRPAAGQGEAPAKTQNIKPEPISFAAPAAQTPAEALAAAVGPAPAASVAEPAPEAPEPETEVAGATDETSAADALAAAAAAATPGPKPIAMSPRPGAYRPIARPLPLDDQEEIPRSQHAQLPAPTYAAMVMLTWVLRILAVLTTVAGVLIFLQRLKDNTPFDAALVTFLGMLLAAVATYAFGEALAAIRDIARNSHLR